MTNKLLSIYQYFGKEILSKKTQVQFLEIEPDRTLRRAQMRPTTHCFHEAVDV